MDDPPVEFIWHDGPVPAGLPVTQVYGWLLCPASGRVLIQEQDDGTFSLPGGTPESFDAGRDATLAREAFEENQVRISATRKSASQDGWSSPSCGWLGSSPSSRPALPTPTMAASTAGT